MENVRFLHPLITRFSTETTAFVYFRLPSLLDTFRRSLLFLVAVIYTVVILSAIPCLHVAASILFLQLLAALPFSHLLLIPVAVVTFLVIWLFHRQPLISSLQLLIANVDSLLSKEFHMGGIKVVPGQHGT